MGIDPGWGVLFRLASRATGARRPPTLGRGAADMMYKSENQEKEKAKRMNKPQEQNSDRTAENSRNVNEQLCSHHGVLKQDERATKR